MCAMLSKSERNAMIAAMRYWMVILFALLFTGCVKSSVQATDELWKRWQAMDELLQADYPDAPPVILVHGWNGSEFTWPDVQTLRRFEQHMHRDVYFFTYRTGVIAARFPPIEILEEQFERYLLPFKQVDVIAHSMGGLIVREYLSHHSKHPIRRLVFLSTPHFGTDAASVLEKVASVSSEGNLQADEMLPGSDFLWQLNAQEGSELEGVQVLNAYVDSDSIFDRDLVVPSYSAWLPWVANVSVAGNHHTLAADLMKQDFLLDFLAFGTLPTLASMPKRRDAWIRIWDEQGKLLPLTANTLRRMDAKLQPNQHDVLVCCERPSALYESARHTLLVEDIHNEDVLWLRKGKDRQAVVIKQVGGIEKYKQPVSLQEITLH